MLRHVIARELDVHHGADTLNDFSLNACVVLLLLSHDDIAPKI
jgi:hypothetical protein